MKTLSRRTTGASLAATAALFGGLMVSLLAPRPAQAQAIYEPEQPFSVKIGAYFPADGDARQAGDDLQFMTEIQYRIESLSETNSTTVLSAAYTQRKNFSMAPLTIAQIFRNPNQKPGTGYYFGIGFGVYITKLRLPDTSGDTKNLVGGYFLGGINLGRTAFAEAKYHLVNTYDRKQIDGLQLSAGYRF